MKVMTMYVCLCNPFTEQDLDKVLKNDAVKKKTAAVYKACTGGEKPCCRTCLCDLKDRIKSHHDETLLMAAE